MPPARPFSVRPLTPAERALAREVFGAALELTRVRILALPLWKRGFVPGPGLIVWPCAALPRDFAEAPLALQGVFVHELAHLWQAQHGVCLPLAKIKAGDSARAYAYELAEETDFATFNIEQQAMVVQHAFLAARGLPAPHAAALYARLGPAWRET